MELNERLIAARKHAGFSTATDAAAALGCEYPTYAGHENGSSGFRHKTAVFYARRFGVSLEWLLTGRGTMTAGASIDAESEYIRAFRSASDEARSLAISVLKLSATSEVSEVPPSAPAEKLPAKSK